MKTKNFTSKYRFTDFDNITALSFWNNTGKYVKFPQKSVQASIISLV